MLSLSASLAILIYFNIRLAQRTELLHADQIRDVFCRRICESCFLRVLEIIEYKEDIIASGQFIRYGFHVAEVPDCFVLHTVVTVRLVVFVFLTR